jgi:hypothetical protein
VSFLIGAGVAGGAYRITEALWDNPGRGRFRGMDEASPFGAVLVAVTAAQTATFSESRLRFGLPLPGVTPLRAIDEVESPIGAVHGLVEDEPAGRPLSAWREDGGLSRAAVLAIGVAVADVAAVAHARGFALGGLRPELVYAEARGDGLAFTAVAPRATGFFATGGKLDAMNIPAFDDVFEPVDVSAARKLPTPASDVFTLAAGLGTLVTGRHPFATGSWAHQIDAMTRVDGGWPGDDDPVLRVLEAALVREPAARPTAAELRDRLAAMR